RPHTDPHSFPTRRSSDLNSSSGVSPGEATESENKRKDFLSQSAPVQAARRLSLLSMLQNSRKGKKETPSHELLDHHFRRESASRSEEHTSDSSHVKISYA